jgi:Spy/CpxP family protein refolding chaperone
MKKLLLITLAVLTLSFMLYAQKADKPPMGKECDNCDKQEMMKKGGGEADMMGPGKEMWKELNLTEEQQQKLGNLKQEQMKFMNTKQAELKNLNIDKDNSMRDGQYDKVKMINKNIADLELAIENAKVDHHMAMMKELTKEQQEKLKEMRLMKGGPMGKPMDAGPGNFIQKGPRN